MHLAVCDDNIADRKQTERLLGRESDQRINSTGVLYVELLRQQKCDYFHPYDLRRVVYGYGGGWLQCGRNRPGAAKSG